MSEFTDWFSLQEKLSEFVETHHADVIRADINGNIGYVAWFMDETGTEVHKSFSIEPRHVLTSCGELIRLFLNGDPAKFFVQHELKKHANVCNHCMLVSVHQE